MRGPSSCRPPSCTTRHPHRHPRSGWGSGLRCDVHRDPDRRTERCARFRRRLARERRDVVVHHEERSPTAAASGRSADVPPNPSENDSSGVELGVKFTSEVDALGHGHPLLQGRGKHGHARGPPVDAAPVRCSRPRRSRVRRARAGRKSLPDRPSRSWRAPSTSPRTTRRTDTTRPTSDFFSAGPLDRPPLHFPQDGVSGGNGVYAYGPEAVFPVSTYQATNYWVDVVSRPVTRCRRRSSAPSPVNGAGSASPSARSPATFNQPVDPSHGSRPRHFELRTSGGCRGSGARSPTWDALAHRLAHGALASASTYTATVRGGASGVRDLAGAAAGERRQLDLHHGRANGMLLGLVATLPSRQIRRRTTRAAVELGVKFRIDAERLHQRNPLLQGHRQHGHAHRQPVDRQRQRCWRRRRSPTSRPPAGSR